MAKIIKRLFDILLILLIIVLIVYFTLRITNVIKIYKVETGSMEDKIHSGDYILLYRKKNYHIGDVITYQTKDYFVTHRIVEINDEKITTKGDANNLADEEIDINQVEGIVVYSGGALNIIINYKFVIVAVLIGLYLLSCYFEKENK